MTRAAVNYSRFASDSTSSNPQVRATRSLQDFGFYFSTFFNSYSLFYGKLASFPHVDKPVDVWITTLLLGINNRLWG